MEDKHLYRRMISKTINSEHCETIYEVTKKFIEIDYIYINKGMRIFSGFSMKI